MTTGRTVEKYTRVFADGYDVSGMARKVGPLELTYAEANLTAMADAVKGYLPNTPHVNCGTLDAVFDNTVTTGIHAVLGTAGTKRTVMVCKGIQAAPAQGDPVFSGVFLQKAYQAANDSGAVTVTIPFSGWAADAAYLQASPWGVLLNANTARTAVNSAIGVDDRGGATTTGGYMTYQVTAGNGTATILVQDAATNTDGSFAALSGATTGSINCAVVQHGIVALAAGATVRRYLRWQITLGTATSVNFVLAFNRG